MIDRGSLAQFLRRRREELHPSDLGFPGGVRRRAVGLRRDEVALQAGISADYYARLEQARGANPSESVIAALARALRLDADQRDHLFRLAGHIPPTAGPGSHIRPGLLQLLDKLPDVPTLICTDLGEVLHQNTLASILLGDFTGPGLGRAGGKNLVWSWFTDPSIRSRFFEADWAGVSEGHVEDLRATSSRRAGEHDVAAFVQKLQHASPEFAGLWQQHNVGVRRSDRKRIAHPQVGIIDLNCEVVFTPDTTLQVIAFFPVEGTDARGKLELLRVIGLQPVGVSS